MADKKVTRQLSIFINDKEVVNSLTGISREMAKVRGQIGNLNRDSADYDDKLAGLKTRLADLTTRQSYFKDEINGTDKALGSSMRSLEGVEKRMKEVEKELRVLDASTEDYQENLAALKDEYAELTARQAEYAQNISLTTEATTENATGLNAVKERMGEVMAELNALDSSSEAYQQRLAALGEEYAALQEAQAQYTDDIAAATKVQAKNKNSLAGIQEQLSQVRNEMNNLDRTSANYREEAARLRAEEERLEEQQAEMNREIHGTTEEMGAATVAFTTFFVSLRSGNLAGAAAGFTGIKAAIIATTNATWAFIKTPIGATIAVLAGIAAVTKEWFDYNNEAAKSNVIFAAITKESGAALDAVRVNSQSLAKAFNQDAEEIANVAAALVSEFGITYDEAFARIQNGFVKGGAASDEFLESMREYPTFFAKAGYSVEEFQNILNTGADLSIYQDKLPDAIKEFALSVEEATPAVREALQNAFGTEFTDRLLAGVKNGSISVKEALVQVSNEAKRLGLNAQQAQQLTADLFRGAGEDAGGAQKIFKAVTQSIENMKRPLSEVEQAVQDLAQSEKDLIEVQDNALKSDGFLRWKTNLLTFFNEVQQGFYLTVSALTNTDEELEEQAAKRRSAQYGSDAIKEFEFYINLRRKRLGDDFDFQVEKEAHIKKLKEQAAAIALTNFDPKDVENFNAMIKALEGYEEKAKVVNENDLAAIKARTEANKKLADEYAKGEAAITAMLKKAMQDRQLDQLEGLDKELKQISLKWDEEKEKYKDHAGRMKELEAAKNAEMSAARQKWEDNEISEGIKRYGTEEKAISDLLKKAQEEREVNRLLGNEREDAAITAKWDAEIEKYADHEDRKAELEEAKAAELQERREERARESAERIKEIELEAQAERNERIFTNAMYLQEYEAENQVNRAIAQAEKEGATQEEIAAIKKRYAEMNNQTGVKAVDFFIALKNQEVKWSELTETQKLALTKQGLSMAADMFNKGSGAWKALKLAEVGIATAQGAINAYQSLAGIPIVGPALGAVAAGVVVAYGAKQMSNISKTKMEKQPKFFFGGYTGNQAVGYDEYGKITGQVHEDEYVIPKAMLADPEVARTAEWLEAKRTGAISPPTPQGGAPYSAGTGGSTPPSGDGGLIATMQAILFRLDNPIAPNLVVGYKEVEDINKMSTEIAASGNYGQLNN